MKLPGAHRWLCLCLLCSCSLSPIGCRRSAGPTKGGSAAVPDRSRATPPKSSPAPATQPRVVKPSWSLFPLVPGTTWHYRQETEGASRGERKERRFDTRVLSRVEQGGLIAAVISDFPTSLGRTSIGIAKVILVEAEDGYTLTSYSDAAAEMLERGDLSAVRAAGKLAIPRLASCARKVGCITIETSSLDDPRTRPEGDRVKRIRGVPRDLETMVEAHLPLDGSDWPPLKGWSTEIVRGLGITKYRHADDRSETEGQLERFVPGKERGEETKGRRR